MAESKKVGIIVKLMKIQGELKAPKNQFNKFGKYNYRSAEDILEAVKPICHDQKCVLILSDAEENGYIKTTATLIDTDDPEKGRISVDAVAKEDDRAAGMSKPQMSGSASSYARKYALNGLFCIDDAKDNDSDEYEKEMQKPVKIYCENCKKEIKPFGKTSAEAIAKHTKKTYGAQLCSACATKEKEKLTKTEVVEE